MRDQGGDSNLCINIESWVVRAPNHSNQHILVLKPETKFVVTF